MNVRRVVLASLLLALLSIAAAPVRATGTSQPAPPQGAKEAAQSNAPAVTLKLTVVILRFEGEKKVGSLPFVLMVIPGGERDGDGTSIQMGSEVPVPTTTLTDGKPTSSYQYRSIGTNITAAGKAADDGRFNVVLSVTDSQVLADSVAGAPAARPDLPPRYQSFRSSNRLLLRDGQTVQYIAASDRTSGEVIKVDVTMNVIK